MRHQGMGREGHGASMHLALAFLLLAPFIDLKTKSAARSKRSTAFLLKAALTGVWVAVRVLERDLHLQPTALLTEVL